MKSTLRILMVVLLLAGVYCLRAAAAESITVKTEKPEVQTRAGAAAEWKTVDQQDTLAPGAFLKTDAAGQATLTWFTDYVVRVRPLSLMEVKALESTGEMRKTELSLEKGRLLAKAPKLKGKDSSFNVKTPTAYAGVRGTAFEIAVGDDNQTIVTSIEDSVFVVAEQVEVILEPGYMTTVLPDEPPTEPVPVPEELIQELRQEVENMAEKDSSAAPDQGGESGEAPDDSTQDPADQAQENVDQITDDVIDNVIEDPGGADDHYQPY